MTDLKKNQYNNNNNNNLLIQMYHIKNIFL